MRLRGRLGEAPLGLLAQAVCLGGELLLGGADALGRRQRPLLDRLQAQVGVLDDPRLLLALALEVLVAQSQVVGEPLLRRLAGRLDLDPGALLGLGAHALDLRLGSLARLGHRALLNLSPRRLGRLQGHLLDLAPGGLGRVVGALVGVRGGGGLGFGARRVGGFA